MEFTLTSAQLFGALAGMCTVVVTVDKLINIFFKWRQKAKAPEEKQNTDIHELQNTDRKVLALLDRDDKRLRVLEDGVSVLVKGQLALLGHAVDGNNEAECKEARKDINHYLITK